MRYRLVLPFFDSDPLRGIEREVVEVANRLSAVGRDVLVVTSDTAYGGGAAVGRPSELSMHVPVLRLPGLFRTRAGAVQTSGAPLFLRGLRSEMNGSDGATIVWNAGWPLTLQATRQGPDSRKRIFFRTYWHPSPSRFLARRNILDQTARMGFSVAGTLLPASSGEAVQLSNLQSRWGPQRPIRVWAPGVDSGLAETQRAPGFIRTRIGASASDKVVLSIGAPSRFKGTHQLLDACRIADSFGEGRIHAVVVGSQPSAEAEAMLSHHRSSGGSVHVLSGLDDRDKLAAIDDADLLVMCSAYESYGFVALEALSRRCPALAFDDFPSSPDLKRYGAVLAPRDTAALAEGISRALRSSIDWSQTAPIPTWDDSVHDLDEHVRQTIRSDN